MPDLTGQSIGRYRLVSLLGQGEMSSVYKALDPNLECNVAIKIISKDNVPASQWQHKILRFEREARQMAKFIHPNIVRVIDYGKYEDSLFL